MILLNVLLLLGLLSSLAIGVPQLLYANRKNICMLDIDGAQTNSTVLVGNLEDAAAVDFIYDHDTRSATVFWTDISQETIQRVSGSSATVSVVVSTGLLSPDGLACDWVGRKLYWTDSEIKRIEVSDLDGRMRKVLFWDGLDQPRAIVVYPQGGLMFWTDWGEEPKIERAGMDGDASTRWTIISNNIFWPNGLTLDYVPAGGRLYWVDGKLNHIHSCRLDGSDRSAVVPDVVPHPFALTLFEGSLYWTDWQTRAIYTYNRTNKSEQRLIIGNLYSPMDIHAYHPSRQPKIDNPCGSDNGGCSHLCLLSPNPPYYQCACPTGVRRLADNRTCADGANEILLLVRRTDIRWVSLDTSDYTDVMLNIRNVKHAIAVDYDLVEHQVYWTDDETRNIRRAYLDGSGHEVVVDTEIDRPDGVAIDWVARNIYWTDTGTDRIEVARLNGSCRKILISDNLLEPRAIVVDPVDGRMYWTDWGTLPKVEKANLDGSGRVVLVNSSLGWPNGLSIDYVERRIYWGDARLDRIESCNLDGSERRIVVENDLPHIFGLTLLGDYLYWTDWIEREINRVHKHNGSQRSLILEQLPDLMGIKAVNLKHVEGENNCSFNNGGCSQLCLNRPQPLDYVCGCATGYELLDDGRTCIMPEAFILYLHRKDIRRLSLEARHTDAVIPLDGVASARALDFDINDSRIYWTDVELKSINRAFLNGSSLEHVIDVGLDTPESISIDWVAHNVYWTDGSTRRIEMARLDGSSRRVLVWQNVNPQSVVVDPRHGYLFWSNLEGTQRLERSGLDGTGRTTFVRDTGRVSGLVIDYEADRLYWASVDQHQIESTDLATGQDRQVVISNLALPYGLTQFRGSIYWTEADKDSHRIKSADKLNGMNHTVLKYSAEEIEDISVFHSSRQMGWNECGIQNGQCSHLCVAFPNSTGQSVLYHCICPTHYTLAADNRTCLPPETFLLLSQRSAITRMLLDTDVPEVVLPISGLKNIRSIDYDPVDSHLYWIDGHLKTIRRAAEDNIANVTIFIQPSLKTETMNPYDLAIDPYSRVVYWSDMNRNSICVARMDGTVIGAIVANVQARSIALAAEAGILFWTTGGKTQKIERSATDGTGKMMLIGTGIGSLGSIAVDTVAQNIYWSDQELKRIEFAKFDGGYRQVLVDGDVGQPLGMYVHGDYLYWVDKFTNTLERVNKTSGQNRTRIYPRPQAYHGASWRISDVVIVKRAHKLSDPSSPCSQNNGDCSHLCVVLPAGGRRCSCPHGLELAKNERTCTTPQQCNQEQFSCSRGFGDCIPASWRCDAVPECEDESDELNCTSCAMPSLFLCRATGRCLLPKHRCNGQMDCPDGSDEENCAPCDLHVYVECKVDKTCINKDMLCNGLKDCPDGSDEIHCPLVVTLDGTHGRTLPYAIGIGVIGGIVLLAFMIILAVCLCRQKAHQQVVLDDRDNIIMVAKALPPATIIMNDDQSSLSVSATMCGIHPPPPSSASLYHKSVRDGSESAYDRDHITGASSSSITTTAPLNYPKHPLNPPPSPVTERSRSVTADRRYAEGPVPKRQTKARLYSKRRRKHRIPPPPTTPCSTDVCEDSEPYLAEVNGSAYMYYIGAGSCCHESDLLCPPPPTPHSQYLSEELSCPPSPNSTEHSFFIPYPPPPPSSVFSYPGSQDR